MPDEALTLLLSFGLLSTQYYRHLTLNAVCKLQYSFSEGNNKGKIDPD